jgi:ankyrin repeat protein
MHALLAAIGRGDAAAVRGFTGAIDASAALFKALARSTPNRQQVLQALRDKGIDFDVPLGKFGSRAIAWGAQQDFITVDEFDWLLKHSGADINRPDDNGGLALHRAIDAGNTRKVWLLLQRPDVDIDAREGRCSAADVAASLPDASVRAEMQRLLAATRDGAMDPPAAPAVAATIPDDVLTAVRDGDTATVEAYSGDLNARCDDNVTVVQRALQVQPTARRLAMLRVLKAKGANFNAPYSRLNALPVVRAASSVDVDVETLAWLVNVNEGGVDVNQRDANGTFALHAAVGAGDVDKVAVLLSRRDLDVDAVDGAGQTAYEYAKDKRLDLIADMIEQRRRDPAAVSLSARGVCRSSSALLPCPTAHDGVSLSTRMCWRVMPLVALACVLAPIVCACSHALIVCACVSTGVERASGVRVADRQQRLPPSRTV